MIRAAIDLGTNTCLLLVGEVSGGDLKRVVSDHSTIVRLGQGVDRTRVLAPEAVDRTLECLRNYAQIARQAGADPALAACVATATARDAKNGQEFFNRVERETGFRFRVISGEEEARLTFQGALLPGMNPSRTAVIDIGGGSTEITTQAGGVSADVGSVRFTERFLKSDPVTDDEFWACQDSIDHELGNSFAHLRDRPQHGLELLAVAGTATTLAAWQLGLRQFDARAIDECRLSRGDVHRLVEELKWRTVSERKKLPGVEEGRADVLLAGALALWRSVELLGFPECRVSTRGLRYGAIQSAIES